MFFKRKLSPHYIESLGFTEYFVSDNGRFRKFKMLHKNGYFVYLLLSTLTSKNIVGILRGEDRLQEVLVKRVEINTKKQLKTLLKQLHIL